MAAQVRGAFSSWAAIADGHETRLHLRSLLHRSAQAMRLQSLRGGYAAWAHVSAVATAARTRLARSLQAWQGKGVHRAWMHWLAVHRGMRLAQQHFTALRMRHERTAMYWWAHRRGCHGRPRPVPTSIPCAPSHVHGLCVCGVPRWVYHCATVASLRTKLATLADGPVRWMRRALNTWVDGHLAAQVTPALLPPSPARPRPPSRALARLRVPPRAFPL